MENDIKKLIYIIIAVILSVIIIKFIFWLLPIILVLVLAYYIYKRITRIKKSKIKVIKNKK